jgi:hypothetical protein
MHAGLKPDAYECTTDSFGRVEWGTLFRYERN